MNVRMEKVNTEIKRKIMEIIQEEIDDPHLGFVSITRVITTHDLRESKVYFSALKDEEIPRIEKSLNKMSGFIRKMLGRKIRIKILPALTFFPDTTIKYSIEINKKIEEVMGDKKDTRNNQKK